MGMVGPRVGQPNVNQLQNQYLSQGQFPGSGPGVATAPAGMAQPGPQAGLAQVSWPEVLLPVACYTSLPVSSESTIPETQSRTLGQEL